MAYTFTAKGHRNILASHKRTLEFTKDDELSPDGDCIVAVAADFSPEELKRLVKNHTRLNMRIEAGGMSEDIPFQANKKFSSDREVVLRMSEFSSDRTFGFRAEKAAAHINRQLVRKLREPGQKVTVTIEPQVKAVLFDFDNTLGDMKPGIENAHHKIAQLMSERHGIYGPTTIKLLEDIDLRYSDKGKGSKPSMYDRHRWFREYFDEVGIEADEKEIDELTMIYWENVLEKARPMPGAKEVLIELKKEYRIGVMTDSDGDMLPKKQRIDQSGLRPYIDTIVVSDEVGINKPNRRFYDIILKKLDVKPEECVMVGDKPQADLVLAKELGMKTVWFRYGPWAESQGKREFDYVDYTIEDMKRLPEILQEI